MLKRRGRSFDSFYPTNAKGLCWQTSTVFTLVNHQAFRAPRFYPFFFFFVPNFYWEWDLTKVQSFRFVQYSSYPNELVLFLNVHVSSAKKFSIRYKFFDACCSYRKFIWMKFVAFEIDRIVSEDTNLSLFSNKSQFRQIKHSSHHVNLSIISSISFIHCTCLLIYLHRFSFFFFFLSFSIHE